MTDRELMKQALEALEEFCEHQTMLRPIEKRDALRERLAQQEQEPVAWMVLGDGEYGEYTPGKHFDTVGYKEYWERRGYELQPLYTAPPQSKPLTDDELVNLWYKQSTDWMEFARAIEAAHGIKVEA